MKIARLDRLTKSYGSDLVPHTPYYYRFWWFRFRIPQFTEESWRRKATTNSFWSTRPWMEGKNTLIQKLWWAITAAAIRRRRTMRSQATNNTVEIREDVVVPPFDAKHEVWSLHGCMSVAVVLQGKPGRRRRAEPAANLLFETVSTFRPDGLLEKGRASTMTKFYRTIHDWFDRRSGATFMHAWSRSIDRPVWYRAARNSKPSGQSCSSLATKYVSI